MIFTLLVGFVVGAFFGHARPFIAETLSKLSLALKGETLALFSLALCLAASTAALSLIGVGSYPVLLCLGAGIGVARKPILARLTEGRK